MITKWSFFQLMSMIHGTCILSYLIDVKILHKIHICAFKLTKEKNPNRKDKYRENLERIKNTRYHANTEFQVPMDKRFW